MTRDARVAVTGVLLVAVLLGLLVLVAAQSLCPGDLPGQPCPDALRNRVALVALAGGSVGTLVAAFAFLAEFAIRGRILYRGAWWRAARRGVLGGGLVAILAALQLAGALSVPAVILFALLAIGAEWFATRNVDVP